MVFRKYKPVTQWGKQDTRIFKAILNARNARRMPAFRIPDAVKNLGVQVYDPNAPGFFESESVQRVVRDHERSRKATADQDHPLYQSTPCHLFDGSDPMSDGMAQACAIAKAVLRTDFPEHILENGIDIDEKYIHDAILHGEKFDPTLEKLPRRFDPVIFWVTHPRVHGTPVIKRGNIILDDLFRHIILAALRSGKIDAADLKLDRDEPLSSCLKSSPYFNERPLVIRGQPHITVHSRKPERPWIKEEQLQEFQSSAVPSIHPLSPLIDLGSKNIYNIDPVVARPQQATSLGLHSLAWTREQSQKYPWTTEQNAANAILYTFGAAMAEAKRRGQRDLTKSPVMARGVQLVDGKIDLVAVQLNTLDLSDGAPQKNIVWVHKALRLYKSRPFYEQLTAVEDLDTSVIKKLSALILS